MLDGATPRSKKYIPVDKEISFYDSKESRKDDLYLYKYEDLPPYFQFNPYILSGYRKFLSYSQCVRSLFKIHNETGNCWTHLIGLVFFFLLTIETVFVRMNSEDFVNKLVFFIFLVSAQICFLGSTVYHLFHCHSEQTMMLASRLDYSGIAALITGSFFPPIYFAFYCYPFWQIAYLSLISFLGISGVILSQFSFYHKHAFTALRISHMVGTALVGFIPLIHALYLGDNMFVANSRITESIMLMYMMYAIGLFFFISKFPESYWKGKFDYWFHSHQFWHVFVIAGAYTHYLACLKIFEARKETGSCPLADFPL